MTNAPQRVAWTCRWADRVPLAEDWLEDGLSRRPPTQLYACKLEVMQASGARLSGNFPNAGLMRTVRALSNPWIGATSMEAEPDWRKASFAADYRQHLIDERALPGLEGSGRTL